MGKESGTDNRDHISESIKKTFLGAKILQFFDADPGSGAFLTPGSGIRDG